MADQKVAIELVKRYVEQCLERNIRFQKVILFGSTIKGNAHEYSDIDVLLVSDQFTDNSLDNWKILAPVTAKNFDIEPHPYPTASFKKGDPFLEEVLQTGVEVI